MAATTDPAKMRKGNTAELKWCPGCEQHKPRATGFWRNAARGDGLRPYCKPCDGAREKARDTQPDRHRRRRYRLARGEFDGMLAAQDGKCAACGDELGEGRQVHVDHDHSTGRVRGVLCIGCNIALGYMKDDPQRIGRLLSYLVASGN